MSKNGHQVPNLGKSKGIPKYEELRDYVLTVSQQEGIKVPKSIGGVDKQQEENEA